MATFLNLYRKTVTSNTKEELSRVADEVTEYYRNKSKALRKKSPNLSSVDPFLACMDSLVSIGVINNVNEEFSVILNTLSLPFLPTFVHAEKPSTCAHIMISGILSTFPVKNYLYNILQNMHFPVKHKSFGLSFGVSTFQVLLSRLGVGCNEINFFDFLLSSLSVSGINYLVAKTSSFLHRFLF